jgi:outer membrane lipoprotein-sorting protein
MRHLIAVLFLIFAAVPASAAGQAPPVRHIELSDADRADLDRVSVYLNSLHTMQGEFVQIGPNGEMDQGKFYLSKPGRLRFEYQPPSPMLVVADGRTLAVTNAKLKTQDRIPLSATPLDLILGDEIDWRRDNAIMRVVHQPGALIVEARTSRNRTKPNISITFSDPQLELRQWTIIDDQGLPTTVALRALTANPVLNDSLFVIRDVRRPVGTKQRD